MLPLARQPEAAGATVFFVTGRPDIIELWTEGNLSSVGYTWGGLANVGNSTTGLVGGHAGRTFKNCPTTTANWTDLTSRAL